jgi:hypothetical protein
MLRRCFVLLTFLAAPGALAVPSAGAAPLAHCDPAALEDAADTARSNIIAAVDGAGALEAWRDVLGQGGAIAWSVTEYNVDARSTFVLTFDRAALRVYRAGAFGDGLEAAMAGCVDPGVEPEAVVPWEDVREIEAGNWVVWFKLRKPVEIRSDRGKHREVRELKAYFHGAGSGDLTYYYNVTRERVAFWNFDVDVYRVENLRGIAVGPTSFQRRLQFVLARAVDPAGRIALPRKGRGAGW